MQDGTELRCTVPDAGHGATVAAWLAARFRYLDAAQWRAEIDAARVSRNGRVAAAGDVLRRGDRVAYAPPPRAATDDGDGDHDAASAPAPVLVHDAPDFAVADKPAGLAAHDRSAFAGNAFLEPLLRAYAARGERPVLRFAHRLDRWTSGLLLLAKTAAAARSFQHQFAAKSIARVYLAVVRGAVAAERFTIDAPIGPDPASASAVAVRRAVLAAGAPGARPACTDVEVVRRLAGHTLVRVFPRTGRTHQIRVHLAHAGHPLAGDPLYGRTDAEYLAAVARWKAGAPAPDAPDSADAAGTASRQMLHAAALACDDPVTGERLAFAAPMPADMAAFVARCER